MTFSAHRFSSLFRFKTLLFILFSVTGVFAIKHSFIAIDEGLNNLLYVNENDSTKNWIKTLNKNAPRDMQLVGNNRILIGHTNGFTEYDITTGAVKRDVSTYDSVSSVRRLPGGYSVIVGVDLNNSKGVVLLKVDSNNVIKKKIVYPGTYSRLVRQTKTGTFLVACNDTLKEADTSSTTGTFIWSMYVAGFQHMWKAIRLDNGNILASAGYGAFMAEITPQKTIARKFGAVPQPTGVNPYFYAMFQLLTNGNCVVANWEGHGAGNATKGIELLEFDPTGAIVWQWNKPAITSSLQGILVLDSLNTALLYDDRNGIMTPLEQNTTDVHAFRNHQTVASQTESTRPALSNDRNAVDALGRQVSVPGLKAKSVKVVQSKHAASGVYLQKQK